MAADGFEAIALAKAFHPRLVLMDLWMPRLDGISACERMRDDEDFAATEFYAVTADRTLATDSLQCFDGWFTKPLEFDRLIPLLDRLAQDDA